MIPIPLEITTSVERSIVLDLFCCGIHVSFDGFNFSIDLVVLCMPNYDVIINMDWIRVYRV